MKRVLFFIFSFSLFVGISPKCNAQHITVPIHYSKWIQNYVANDSLRGVTTFSTIPIAFYMKEANGKVEQFEKLEIGINLPDDAQILISNFIRKGRGVNPFDPDQLKITAAFSHNEKDQSFKKSNGNETITLVERDAFYYEEFNVKNDDLRFKHGSWRKDTSIFNFRVRFAPNKTGRWSCTINIQVNGELKYSLPTFEFICSPGKSNGFITGVSKNKRLLQFENGNNFFGIGQNIPFADLPNSIQPDGTGPTREQPPLGYQLQREYIEDLAANGGNLVRLMHGEWTDALEWEKLNDYSMNMNFAWEFDQTVNLCQEKNIYILWLQQVHTAFMARNPYNNDALAWPMNPYHVYLKLEKPEDFFRSEEAMKHYKNKIRYMLSRWGYSRMIVGIQPMSELNEMAANITDAPAHHPYFTDTAFRNNVGKWFLEIKNYIQKDLNYSFLIGSSYTGDVGAHVVNDPIMSIADFNDYHPYAEDRSRNIGGRFGGINMTPGYGIFKRFEKPTIIGEMGTWSTEYLQECNENEFHTDLWATTFMGGWAGGLHWHNWEDNYKMNLRNNFIGLRAFLNEINLISDDVDNTADIPWTPHRWPQNNVNDSIYSEKKDNYFESLYMTGDKSLFNETRAFGWVHNRSHYWYNLPETDCEKELSNKKSKQSNGKKAFRPADDDIGGFEKYEGKENESKRIMRISNLKNFKKYSIKWYDTETGNLKMITNEFHFSGKFKVKIPDEINQTTYQDLAFTIQPARKTFLGEKIKKKDFFCNF
jgi:hypothetical protein